jgi:hypothetical protein
MTVVTNEMIEAGGWALWSATAEYSPTYWRIFAEACFRAMDEKRPGPRGTIDAFEEGYQAGLSARPPAEEPIPPESIDIALSTLMDEFAKAALNSLIIKYGLNQSDKEMAAHAYKIARAMMRARPRG